jgi:allatostatin A receptor
MVALSVINNTTWNNFSQLTNNFTRVVIEDDEQWPLERIVSIVVPFCFGIIGLAGLLGNALVVMGKSNNKNK